MTLTTSTTDGVGSTLYICRLRPIATFDLFSAGVLGVPRGMIPPLAAFPSPFQLASPSRERRNIYIFSGKTLFSWRRGYPGEAPFDHEGFLLALARLYPQLRCFIFWLLLGFFSWTSSSSSSSTTRQSVSFARFFWMSRSRHTSWCPPRQASGMQSSNNGSGDDFFFIKGTFFTPYKHCAHNAQSMIWYDGIRLMGFTVFTAFWERAVQRGKKYCIRWGGRCFSCSFARALQ